MDTQMKTTENTPQVQLNAAAAGDPAGTPKLTPDVVVQQLRALQAQIPDIAPLTKEERAIMRRFARTPGVVVDASITVIGASDIVTQAVGQPAEEVRQMAADAVNWTPVENELKAMFRGVSDANLVRRQRVGLAAARAYLIAQQVARDPNNAALRPHVDEVKRLKALARRKKPATQTPQPQPAPATLSATTQEKDSGK
jgi:hypothetical protein